MANRAKLISSAREMETANLNAVMDIDDHEDDDDDEEVEEEEEEIESVDYGIEEEEEEENEEEKKTIVPTVVRPKNPRKQDHAQGSRATIVPSYRAQVVKRRNARKKNAVDDEGNVTAARAHRRANPGNVAQFEMRHLQRVNGTLIPRACIRRKTAHAVTLGVAKIERENSRVARRLVARQKPVPRNVNVAQNWSISRGYLELLRSATEAHLDAHSELARTLRTHSGRIMVSGEDVDKAALILMGRN